MPRSQRGCSALAGSRVLVAASSPDKGNKRAALNLPTRVTSLFRGRMQDGVLRVTSMFQARFLCRAYSLFTCLKCVRHTLTAIQFVGPPNAAMATVIEHFRLVTRDRAMA